MVDRVLQFVIRRLVLVPKSLHRLRLSLRELIDSRREFCNKLAQRCVFSRLQHIDALEFLQGIVEKLLGLLRILSSPPILLS